MSEEISRGFRTQLKPPFQLLQHIFYQPLATIVVGAVEQESTAHLNANGIPVRQGPPQLQYAIPKYKIH